MEGINSLTFEFTHLEVVRIKWAVSKLSLVSGIDALKN